MKIKWTDFSNRRKVTLDNFKHMDYQEYSRWCAARGVEPVSLELFPKAEKIKKIENIEEVILQVGNIEPEPITEIELEEISEPIYTQKGLSKMKKVEVQYLCDQLGAEYTGSHTKRQLVQKILSLNI
jgi:hypothetical protein